MTRPVGYPASPLLGGLIELDDTAAEVRNGPVAEYQALLRVIGAVLDDLDAHDVTLIEGINSFSVSYRHGVTREVRDLTFGDLLTAYVTRRGERKLLGTPSKGRYQDLLRALGFELESAGARRLVLTEDGDNVSIEFETGNAEASLVGHHHVILTPAMAETILQRAHSRRQRRRSRLLSFLPS
ncbi:MAG TPA: hypothetical protein VFB58_01555 [Chloroflexota bacterium]|nr:hypothetical protein [Chloroflexota bacterium]